MGENKTIIQKCIHTLTLFPRSNKKWNSDNAIELGLTTSAPSDNLE